MIMKPCIMTTPTTSSSTHKMKLGVIAMLCMGLFITVAACVLCRSGDIETNPGPGCECNIKPIISYNIKLCLYVQLI